MMLLRLRSQTQYKCGLKIAALVVHVMPPDLSDHVLLICQMQYTCGLTHDDHVIHVIHNDLSNHALLSCQQQQQHIYIAHT